ncbi:MAG TPA: PQQ-binding-like beta-propeller repeat protein [Acetobacteraceae bacterium]|jgi:outer membrane protein assembly factor BamB
MAQETPRPQLALARRAALLAPLALAGCSTIEGWFSTNKKLLPGERETVLTTPHGLVVGGSAPKVALPPPVRNAAWPQAGGNPAHLMGHLAANPVLAEAWRSEIGDGGGYRRTLMAQPVVSAGRVFAMDSNANVTAFQLGNGAQVWRARTRHNDGGSTNVGGGLAVANGVLYAVNGLGDLVAFEAATGKEKWRKDIGVPLRSAPTVVEDRIFVVTIDGRMLTLTTTDGRQLWEYQASSSTTDILGQPAPAFATGLVVAGFGSGDLVCMRADTGTVIWSDSLGGGAAPGSVVNFSSVRGRPAISNNQVFAIGMGGLAVGIDLPTGRRLWERDVAGLDSPWVAGGWMFVVSSDQKMAAISTSDGSVAWVTDLPAWTNPEKEKGPISWYGPVLVTDRLVVASTSNDALSVSPYTGRILSRQALSAAAAPLEPVVAEGTLLIVSNDGRLLALR